MCPGPPSREGRSSKPIRAPGIPAPPNNSAHSDHSHAELTPSAWSFGLALAAEPGRGDSGQLEADLSELIRDLSEAAQEQDRGLAILSDESQDLSRDDLK